MNNQTCWIILGDIHDMPENLHKVSELAQADGILITGDITFAGNAEKATKTLAPFVATGKRIVALPGNMDTPSVETMLTEKSWNLHRTTTSIANITCMGLGYSPPTPFNTPGEFSEDLFASWLEEIMTSTKVNTSGNPWFLISHTPPINTNCDKITGGISVGSSAVRGFIEKYQPDYCFCGHIHESIGTDTIGKTTIVNPGAFSEGGYAVLYCDTSTNKPTFTIELKQIT